MCSNCKPTDDMKSDTPTIEILRDMVSTLTVKEYDAYRNVFFEMALAAAAVMPGNLFINFTKLYREAKQEGILR